MPKESDHIKLLHPFSWAHLPHVIGWAIMIALVFGIFEFAILSKIYSNILDQEIIQDIAQVRIQGLRLLR